MNTKFTQESLERAAINILSVDYLIKIFSGLQPSLKIILLKGEAILDVLHENRGERCLVELDILVREGDFPEVKNHLAGGGFCFDKDVTSPLKIGYVNSVMCLSGQKHYPAIHLHWHLVNNAVPSYMFAHRIDMDKIWQEAHQVEGLPSNILFMAPHHQLIYSCEHAVKHSFENPKELFDIDGLIRRHKEDLDWGRIVSDAKEFNLARPVYHSLYLASQILGTEVPANIFTELRPKKVTLLERRFVKRVLNNQHNPDSSFVIYLAMNEGPADKIKFIFRAFFPPREAMSNIIAASASRGAFIDYLNRFARGIQLFWRLLGGSLGGSVSQRATSQRKF